MSNYIALAALLTVCFIGYMTDKYERKLKKQADELSERLSVLERNIPTAAVSKMFFRWVAEATEAYFENPDVKRRFEEWKKEKAKKEVK